MHFLDLLLSLLSYQYVLLRLFLDTHSRLITTTRELIINASLLYNITQHFHL